MSSYFERHRGCYQNWSVAESKFSINTILFILDNASLQKITILSTIDTVDEEEVKDKFVDRDDDRDEVLDKFVEEDEAEDEHEDEDKLLQRETISAAPLAGHPLTVNLGGGQQFGGQPICSTVNKQFGQKSTNKIWST